MTLESSVKIFQVLEPLYPQQPLQPQQPQWPQWPWRPHFIKKFTDPDGCWIIAGTQMNNTGPFLCIGSSEVQFFTDVTFLKTGW